MAWQLKRCSHSVLVLLLLCLVYLANGNQQIAQTFDGTVAAIKAKIKAGENPTPQIIAHILKDQCSKAQGILKKEPQGNVRAACVQAFASVGWDFNKNRGVGNNIPSIDKVMSMLESVAKHAHAVQAAAAAGPRPTAEELKDLKLATDKLWQLDKNRLNPEYGDYRLNLQQGKSFVDRRDVAPDPLFSYVKPELLRKPTFAAFIALLDNYNASTGTAEVVTKEEVAETSRFLDTIMATPVMQYCHRYLAAKKLSPADAAGFKRQLHAIWFQLYSRSGRVADSSGFEHVFVGEIKDNQVIGFHNWIRFYLEEKAGNMDYRGWIRPSARRGQPFNPPKDQQLLRVNFVWNGVMKEASTIFIGTSPEFEIALYTMCFLAGNGEKAVIKLGPYHAEISCHKFTVRGQHHIGSSYVGELSPSQAEAAAFKGVDSRRINQQ